MAYTEFYCDPVDGDNLNAGSTSGAATFSFTGGDWNGSNVYTAAGQDLSGVAADQFASIYADGASAPTGYVAKIIAVDNSAKTITLSTSAISGTAPGSGTANRTIRVGGAWKGPNASSGFPFGFIANTLVLDPGSGVTSPARVSFKNNATYSITAAMVQNKAGPFFFCGYSATPGDGGKAIFDGGATGSSYVLLTDSGSAGIVYQDFIFQNNGDSGTSNGVATSGSGQVFRRIVFHDIRGNGFSSASTRTYLVECEAYNCNQSGTANNAGFAHSSVCIFLRCLSHDNSASGSIGFNSSTQGGKFIHCIADTNASYGFRIASGTGPQFIGCDAYNNGNSGIIIVTNSNPLFLNCNLVKNTGYGIEGVAGTTKIGWVQNCGFGGGAYANTLGTIGNAPYLEEQGSVNYTTHPYNDPGSGDFCLSASQAISTGRGNFTQTAGSFSGTLGYPDIGAAIHQEIP